MLSWSTKGHHIPAAVHSKFCSSSLTKSRRRAKIVPILRSLHWRDVSFLIEFKILLSAYQMDYILWTMKGPQLQGLFSLSSSTAKRRTKTCDDALDTPGRWNSLLEDLREAANIDTSTLIFYSSFMLFLLLWFNCFCFVIFHILLID